MNNEQLKELKGLARKLVIGEARKIRLALCSKRINRKFNNSPNFRTIEETKKDICSFFEKYKINFNPRLLCAISIKNIEEYEKKGFIEPSYEILNERVERGEYDFDFSKV